MTEESRHFKDELQDIVDVRLVGNRLQEVTAHLDRCEECRSELQSLRWVKAVAAASGAAEEVPAGLAAKISASLDREDEKTTMGRSFWLRARKPVAVASLLLAPAVVALVLYFRGDVVARAVARDYQRYMAGEIPLDLNATDPPALEDMFRDRGIDFPPRVLDLGMMGYQVIGGRVYPLAGRQSTLFVYQNEDGSKILVCRMYRGSVDELSGGDEVRRNNDIDFFIHHFGEIYRGVLAGRRGRLRPRLGSRPRRGYPACLRKSNDSLRSSLIGTVKTSRTLS